jgi:hypothetical protein
MVDIDAERVRTSEWVRRKKRGGEGGAKKKNEEEKKSTREKERERLEERSRVGQTKHKIALDR